MVSSRNMKRAGDVRMIDGYKDLVGYSEGKITTWKAYLYVAG
jgi:hypothetical protein